MPNTYIGDPIPMDEVVHIDIRLTLKKVTERIHAHPSGDIVDEWTHLMPVSLTRLQQTGEADADELYDVAETIAETDDFLETFTNGSLDLIHSNEPHQFRNFTAS